MTCCIEPVAEKKKKNPFTVAFIFVVALHARLATVLTGPLCKLQSEAGLGLLAYSLGEVVRKEKTELRLADMETAEIAFDIYGVVFAFSQEHVDKRHLKISRVFPFDC